MSPSKKAMFTLLKIIMQLKTLTIFADGIIFSKESITQHLSDLEKKTSVQVRISRSQKVMFTPLEILMQFNILYNFLCWSLNRHQRAVHFKTWYTIFRKCKLLKFGGGAILPKNLINPVASFWNLIRVQSSLKLLQTQLRSFEIW